MQIIPFKQPAQWQEQIVLTGTVYILRFSWNALNEFWVMDIFDINLNPIVYGIKIVVNYDLTEQFKAAIIGVGIPFGDIVCINYTEADNKITRFEMGQNVDLFYYEPGEFVVVAVND